MKLKPNLKTIENYTPWVNSQMLHKHGQIIHSPYCGKTSISTLEHYAKLELLNNFLL